uniref:Uncharacterized protein n=1 Tax=Megaselia scalaris TaxID=36166 RepID=T1H1T1_MEGSC
MLTVKHRKIFVFLYIFQIFHHVSSWDGDGNGNAINVGLITDSNFDVLSRIFSKAIEDVNVYLETPLRPVVREISFG